MSHRPRALGTRRSSASWPIILALASAAGGWLTGTAMLWRLCVLLLLLVVLCWIYSKVCLRGIACVRRLPHTAPLTGDELPEEFVLVNRAPWPILWVHVTGSGDLPGYKMGHVCSLGGRSQARWTHVTSCAQRGRYDLDDLVAQVGDPFGLFVTYRRLGHAMSVLVLPRPVPVQIPPLVALGGPPTVEAPSLARGGERTVLLRPAMSGDRLTHIAWPPSLRTGTLLVRQEEAANPWGVRLVVDLAGVGDEEAELVTGVAVYVARDLLRMGHAVGLVCGGGALLQLPATHGSGHARRIWEILAEAPLGSDVALGALLMLPVQGLGLAVVSVSGQARDLLAAGPPRGTWHISASRPDMAGGTSRRGTPPVSVLMMSPAGAGFLAGSTRRSSALARG